MTHDGHSDRRERDRDYDYADGEELFEPYRPRIAPGKVTLTSQLAPAPVQFRGAPQERDDALEVARAGVEGGAAAYPYEQQIQAAFGRHSIEGIRAHAGPEARRANDALGSIAFATGRDVAFRDGAPDLHTAAHEAAHVVQQRAGVQLDGGVGQSGDRYERHADAVADAVVRGESAEALLGDHAGGGQHAGVQRKGEVKIGDTSVDTKGTVKTKILGVGIEVSGNSVKSKLPLPKKEKEKKIEWRSPAVYLFKGVFVYVKVGGSAKAALDGDITADLTRNEDDSLRIGLTGKYGLSGAVGFTVSVVAGGGAPGVLSVNAEGRATGEAKFKALEGQVGGSLTSSPAGDVTGEIKGDLDAEATLEASLSAHLTYDVFWKEGSTEFAKYVFDTWEIAEASAGLGGAWNASSGEFSGELRKPTFKWGDPPAPKVEGKSYEELLAELRHRRGGGSGASATSQYGDDYAELEQKMKMERDFDRTLAIVQAASEGDYAKMRDLYHAKQLEMAEDGYIMPDLPEPQLGDGEASAGGGGGMTGADGSTQYVE